MDEQLNKNYIPTAPVSVSAKKTLKIFEQLKNSIFEIKCKEKNSTGFLCKINYENEIKNALIMNYNIYVEKLKENKIMEIYFNDGEDKKTINLENSLKKNETLNIVLIEIEDNINDFLELDENLLRDDSELVYKDKSIYVLQYKEENQASVSYGLILDIVGNEITINNDIGEGSLGAPILNLSTNKVIGICKGITTKGSLIRKDFNFNHKMDESYPKNEIKVTFNIQQEDIGKKIYYMYNISKNKDENNYLDNKEDNLIARVKSSEIYHYFINDYHPKIYIDGIENKEFDYCFEPTEAKLYTVIIKFTKEIPDCSYMFYDCDRIISIDLSFFDSKKVNNMRYMFNGCSNLRHIYFSNIDTRNVINMERMFCNCYKLKYLDLSNFNTKNVIYMDFMFYNA